MRMVIGLMRMSILHDGIRVSRGSTSYEDGLMKISILHEVGVSLTRMNILNEDGI